MKKMILKFTFAVVVMAASCLGARKAYDAYGYEENSILMENVEALSDDNSETNSGQLVQNDYIVCDDGTNLYTSTRIAVSQMMEVVHLPNSNPKSDDLQTITTFSCVSIKGPNRKYKGSSDSHDYVTAWDIVDCDCPLKEND